MGHASARARGRRLYDLFSGSDALQMMVLEIKRRKKRQLFQIRIGAYVVGVKPEIVQNAFVFGAMLVMKQRVFLYGFHKEPVGFFGMIYILLTKKSVCVFHGNHRYYYIG